MSTNRVAAPWQRTRVDRYLARRDTEADKTAIHRPINSIRRAS